MKKLISLLATTAMMLSLAGCGGTTTPTATTTPTVASEGVSGTFSGEGSGKGGKIAVDVTLTNGELTDIKVTESHETGIISDSMDIMKAEMLEKNSPDVDMVAGATLSSAGFKKAVKDAISKSGATLVEKEVPKHEPVNVDETYDVVVIGAGGAGLSAAITASEAGAKVAVIDKLQMSAGNTLISGAEYAAPNNWIQKEEGIEDSPEAMAEDMLTGGDNLADPELVKTLCENALSGAEWLRDDVKVEWTDELMHFGGHSITRSLVPKGATGEELITKLVAKAKDAGITLYYNVSGKEILMEDGKAIGVYGESRNGDTYTLKANRGVILATGGFGSNQDMVKQYNPELVGYKSTDSVADTGDGITMAIEAGAELVGMEYIQTYPMCDVVSGGLLYVDDARLYGYSIMVNKEGDRFVNELGRRDVLSQAILAQTGGVCYEVMDNDGWEKASIVQNHGGEVEYLTANKKLVKADTLDEAADFFGIDKEELAKTIATYNGYVDVGKDDDFDRLSMNMKIENGPFYIVEATPAIHHTMGGVKINTNAEVIDTNGNVIPNLYAAGEVTGGIHGSNRLGSCAIADITVFGRIAGANAANNK